MAAWIAEGVAEVHAVDAPDGPGEAGDGAIAAAETGGGGVVDVPTPSLIHNDINMDNLLLGRRGGVEVPVLNDFNIAVFRKKDARTGEPCRFRGRFANPQVSAMYACKIHFSDVLNSMQPVWMCVSGCPQSSKNGQRTSFQRDT